MPSKKTGPLSNEQLTEVLGLIKGADSVELKLTIPDEDRRSTVRALGIDPIEAQIRQVVFFDTPALDLNQQGVVVRARRIQADPATRSSSCARSFLPTSFTRAPEEPELWSRGRRHAGRVRVLGLAQGSG